jgi:hypothetical protein
VIALADGDLRLELLPDLGAAVAMTGHKLLGPAERCEARVTLSVINSDN